MKKVLAFLLFFAFALTLNAQDDGYYEDAFGGKSKNPMRVGGFISYGGGVNAAETEDGIKNRFLIANMIDIGATFYYPISSMQDAGILADLGYFTTAFGYETDPGGNQSDYFFEYISFNPSFWFKGFRAGVNFAFPIGGTLIPDNSESDSELEISNDQMASPMIELSLGAYVPIVESKTGSLNFILNVSYALTGQVDSDFLDEGIRNQHPAAVRVGLSYLFKLNK